jgi:hypothetical protein
MNKGADGARRWDLAVFFTEMQTPTRVALRNYVAKGKKV